METRAVEEDVDKAAKEAEENKRYKTVVLSDDDSASLLNDLGKTIVNNKKIKKK